MTHENESPLDRAERILEDIAPHLPNGQPEGSAAEPIYWEETKRIVAANEETIKRYERERPAREAKRAQRRAEFQAMIEQLRQSNAESIRRSEEWRKRNHL